MRLLKKFPPARVVFASRGLGAAQGWRSRGEADPILVMIVVGVAALIGLGISVSLVSGIQWGTTMADNAEEQAGEDTARLAWMGDVGTAERVIPAARSGTDAQSSVRFVSSDWQGSGECRAVTWWVEERDAEPDSMNAYDETGVLRPVSYVHRHVAFHASASGGQSCAGAPLRETQRVMIRNAAPGAKFEYVNGHLRDLAYPSTINPSRESCEGVEKTDESGLVSCVAASQTERKPQRSLWEWADPTPAQVLLVMDTTQTGMGKGYGTQIGWREEPGRLELTGSDDPELMDTLDNPPTPAAATTAPSTRTVNQTSSPNDPTLDRVEVRRTDSRPLDGFEYQCRSRVAGTSSWGGWSTHNFTNPQPANWVTVPSTSTGREYECRQRGWVNAVAGPLKNQRFPGGVAPWSPSSDVTRRPAVTTIAGTLPSNNRARFTWPTVTGVTGWELQYRYNDGTWSDVVTLPATTLQWSYPSTMPVDSRVQARVRATNAGGTAPYVTSSWVIRGFTTAPVVAIPSGAVGVASYQATWPAVSGFNASDGHTYQVDLRRWRNGSWGSWTTPRNNSTRNYNATGVQPGETVRVRVRVEGNYSNSPWSNNADAQRPVAPPTGSITVNTRQDQSGTSSRIATVRSSWSGASCESGATRQYQYRTRKGSGSWSGWSSWGNATSVRGVTGTEGQSINVGVRARCTANTRNTSATTAVTNAHTIPYTRTPSVPTVTGPSPASAAMGRSISFGWSSNGSYYQVRNRNLSTTRYTGTATSRTFTQESNGGTCVRARAAYSKAHADAGAWSGYSGSRCAALLTAPAVAPSFVTTPEWWRGAGANPVLARLRIHISSVSGATSYPAAFQMEYQNGSRSVWHGLGNIPTGSAQEHSFCAGTVVAKVHVRVAARNSVGQSNWRTIEARAAGALNACF